MPDPNSGGCATRPWAATDERRVLAAAITRLVDAGVIARDPVTVARAAKVLGVRVGELPPLGGTAEVPEYRRRAGQAQRERHGNVREDASGQAERRCCRCGLWLPDTDDFFLVRNRKTGNRVACCHDCRRDYQATRYLSVELGRRLAHLVAFVVAEGDGCEGDACEVCHDPLLAGQEVKGETQLVHTGCLP